MATDKNPNKPQRYSHRIGYFEVLYGDGSPFYWDMDYFIWDDHLRIYIDENGVVLDKVFEEATCRVAGDIGLKDRMWKAIKRLNEESEAYDKELKAFTKK